jgi:hypothetical protein
MDAPKNGRAWHAAQPPTSRDAVITLHDAGHRPTALVRPTIQSHGLFEIQ